MMTPKEVAEIQSYLARIEVSGFTLQIGSAFTLRPKPETREEHGFSENAVWYFRSLEEAVGWVDGFDMGATSVGLRRAPASKKNRKKP